MILTVYVTLMLTGAGLVLADGLNARAKSAGKLYFGTAVGVAALSDASSNAILKNTQEFGQITCESEMKFDATEPGRGSFNYANADKIVAQAQASGQLMRCHTLIWYNSLPNWVSYGGFNNATLISIMQNHIANVVGHFKGKCLHWDVVNEALNDDGSFRRNIWYNTIGPAYIPIAFAAAAAADPAAKLFYNDYSCEKAGAKSTAAQNLIKMVKAYGAPIHGMGLQGHMKAGSVGSASGLVSNLNAFGNLGVDVVYTEVDIDTPALWPDLNQQATDYAAVVSACKQVSRCRGITIWGFTDKHTWLSNSLPLPWSTSLQKKPAYTSILNAWSSARPLRHRLSPPPR